MGDGCGLRCRVSPFVADKLTLKRKKEKRDMIEFNNGKFSDTIEKYTKMYSDGLISMSEFLEVMGKLNNLHNEYSKTYLQALKFDTLSKTLDSF